MVVLREDFDNIDTVGGLRAALADLPDDFAISTVGDAIIVEVWENSENGEEFATITAA